MTTIFFYFMFSIAVGLLANSKGRSFVAWMIVAMLLSPVVGGLFVLCLGRADKKRTT